MTNHSIMRSFVIFIILSLNSFSLLAQEQWDYLPITLSNYRHGHIVALDEETLHVATDTGNFYKSIDGGITWSIFNSGIVAHIYDMAFYNDAIGYVVGINGTILKTNNAGESWSTVESNTDLALVSVATNSANSVWAVGIDGIILHSEDSGETWETNQTITNEFLYSVRFKSESEGYISGSNGLFLYTDNGGDSWTQIDLNTNTNLYAISFIENQTNVVSGTVHYYSDQGFIYWSELIYKSTDNINWTPVSTGYEFEAPADVIFTDINTAYSESSSEALCMCCTIVIYKTTDGGTEWETNYYEYIDNGNSCYVNSGYGRFAFPSPDVGYLLLGTKILKTPYIYTGSIDTPSLKQMFTIYPNPTRQGQFNVKINSYDFKNTSLQIVDGFGKLIYQENVKATDHAISIPNLAKGIYFVRFLQNGNTITTQKLINH